MSINLLAKPSGTQGALQLNGVDAVVYDATGIVSGVNKSAVSQQATLGTAIATTSGTSHDFTGIPSWVKRITVMFNGVSTNGTSLVQVQIGDGSVVTSGYSSSTVTSAPPSTVAFGSATTGYLIGAGAGSAVRTGSMTLNLVSGNTWVSSHIVMDAPDTVALMGSGVISLGSTLDRVRLTTVNGTDTFDAGSINILYE